MISTSEQQYIISGLDVGQRNDGRGLLTQREVQIERDVIPSAHGSVKLTTGLCEITCTLKVDLYKGKDAPDIGCSVENLNNKDTDTREATHTISRAITRLLNSKAATNQLNKILCIVPGAIYWAFYVDVVISGSDGNILSFVSHAIREVFACSTLPKLAIVPGETSDSHEVELDTSGVDVRVRQCRIPKYVVVSKIGNHIVIDCTQEEELCVSSSVIVCVYKDKDENSMCEYMQKVGIGSLSIDTMQKMIHICLEL